MVSSPPSSIDGDELHVPQVKKAGGSGLATPERPLMDEQNDLVRMSDARRHERLSSGAGKKSSKLLGVFRTVCQILSPPDVSCKWITLPSGPSEHPALGSRVTGTLFGFRKSHVHFAVQEDPKSHPVFLLELDTPTSTLVKEMASGLVRIALECEKTSSRGKLFHEPVWTMYCNGHKTGYAVHRECSEADINLLSLVQAVSMGAGVLPMTGEASEGELMYMRAKFERVVGSRDSEAFYMMNPDGTGGPELSIFLLRI